MPRAPGRSPRSAAAWLLFAWALAAGAPTRAQHATGSIEGRVVASESGRPVAGVTVTVSGPALPGEQTAFSDASGHYLVTALPPGADYLLRFCYADVKVERPGVQVLAGRTLSIPVRLPAVHPQVLRIDASSPTLDVASSTVGVTTGEDVIRNLPLRGRTYDSFFGFAPGASTDPVGFVFHGATGLESSFTIDGLNTTNPVSGLMGTHLSVEFIKQADIITGGAGAEYGRATGGFVNVVTKSGTNELHGSAWFNDAPLSLDPRTVARLGEAIAVRARGGSGPTALDGLDHAVDFGFDVGGPLVKDRAWLYLGFAPSFYTQTYDRMLRSRVATTEAEAAMGGAADPGVSCPPWLSSQDPSLCVPSSTSAARTASLDPKFNRQLQSDSRLYNYIAKLTLRISDNHHVTVSYIGSPSTFDGVGANPRNPGHPFPSFNADPAILSYQNGVEVHDVVARSVSKLARRQLQLELLAGFHHEHSSVVPASAGAAGGSVFDFGTSPLRRYEDVAPCAPTTIGNTPFNPCPVSAYQYGGFGSASDVTSQRFVAAAALTWFIKGAGTHALKLGGDFELETYSDHEWYTGGAAGGRFVVLPDGSLRRRQLAVAGADGGSVTLLGNDDPAQSGFTARTSTFDYSLYLRDSWSLSFLPGLTLNAGVRWDAQELKDPSGATRLGIYDNIAPRIGLAYDFLRNGRTKFFAHYGRFYEAIPLDLNNRQFGGAGLSTQRLSGAEARASCQADANGRIDVASCLFPAPSRGDVVIAEGLVAPHVKGQFTDEVIAGLQWDVGWDVVIGAAYVHREIGRIIDDVSPDFSHFIITNPGEPTDAGAVADVQKQIAALDRQIGATTDAAARDALVRQRDRSVQQLASYRGAASYPRPRRDYNALQLTLTRRFGERLLLLASYTYSRTIGNYPGLYSPTSGQVDPNNSTQYDFRDLLQNATGPLPQDRPHNLKIAGAYRIPLGGFGALTVGLNFTLLSGAPIDVLGSHPLYSFNQVFILPRGSGGRLPALTQLDLHLGWGRMFGRSVRAEITADVFNVLDQQEVTAVDEQYTADDVNPIANGTYADLPSLKTTQGTAPHLNPAFGQPIAYQAPMSMRLGARLSF